MHNYVSKVVAIALAEVGYLEKKNGNLKYLYDKTANAGSANYTKYGYEMHQLYPAVMDYPAYWCDAMVDWCFCKAYGVSNAKGLLGGNFNDYTVASAQLYKNKNAYHKSNPKVGDQIFFDNGKKICHTGIVYKVDDKYVYTIEGNTSSLAGVVANGGCVALKKYALNYKRINGYGRPKYDVESSNVKKSYMHNGLDYSAVFDAEYYANRYADLKAVYKADASKLFNHFISKGMSEARQAIDTFNVLKYQSYYSDLQQAFKSDLPAYYKHYIVSGKAENRKAI